METQQSSEYQHAAKDTYKDGTSESATTEAADAYFDEFVNYQGFWYSPWFAERIKHVQDEFKAEGSDILLCSYPKSGTTWLKALTFAIMTRKSTKVTNNHSDPIVSTFSSNPLLKLNPHECVKFLEATASAQDFDPKLYMENPRRLLATHIPYTSLPQSLTDSSCKIVYICRDPRDVLVSGWKFSRKFIKELEGMTLEKALDLFCLGIRMFGPIWDHVLGYWNASQKQPDRILFIKYEDLKTQTSYYVKKLAEFLDQPFSKEEEENGAVENIIKVCSLGHLSNLDANKSGAFASFERPIENKFFFRKGQVGDWKNYLTPEMNYKLENIISGKFSGSGLNILYDEVQSL